MADVKISGLPASTTPLAGTEVLPIVQGGQTRQVSVANLTAGRAVSASSLALTGSALPVTSGGSGTATQFTAGSVVFAGTSGVYSQSNTQLFWSTANNRLGLGNAAPAAKFHLSTAGEGSNIPTWYEFSTAQAIISTGDSSVANTYTKIQGGIYNAASTVNLDLIVQAKDPGKDAGWRLTSGCGANAGADNGYLAISKIKTNTTAIVPTEVGRFSSAGNWAPANGLGIDFSANPNAPGATSELLADYEEGTWTATLTGSTAAPTTPVTATCPYTKVGNQVTVTYYFGGVNTTGATGDLRVTGLPFTVGGGGATTSGTHGTAGINGFGADAVYGTAQSGTTRVDIRAINTTVQTPMVAGAGKFLMGTVTYFV